MFVNLHLPFSYLQCLLADNFVVCTFSLPFILWLYFCIEFYIRRRFSRVILTTAWVTNEITYSKAKVWRIFIYIMVAIRLLVLINCNIVGAVKYASKNCIVWSLSWPHKFLVLLRVLYSETKCASIFPFSRPPQWLIIKTYYKIKCN